MLYIELIGSLFSLPGASAGKIPPYLEAVIRESMRRYPVAAMGSLRQVNSAGGCTLQYCNDNETTEDAGPNTRTVAGVSVPSDGADCPGTQRSDGDAGDSVSTSGVSLWRDTVDLGMRRRLQKPRELNSTELSSERTDTPQATAAPTSPEQRSLTIPKDSYVLVNFFALHNCTMNWGEDALEFKPERWLPHTPPTSTQASDREPFAEKFSPASALSAPPHSTEVNANTLLQGQQKVDVHDISHSDEENKGKPRRSRRRMKECTEAFRNIDALPTRATDSPAAQGGADPIVATLKSCPFPALSTQDSQSIRRDVDRASFHHEEGKEEESFDGRHLTDKSSLRSQQRIDHDDHSWKARSTVGDPTNFKSQSQFDNADDNGAAGDGAAAVNSHECVRNLLSSPGVFGGGGMHKDDLHFAPFSYGPRNCLGMSLALLEIRTAALELVRNFSFALVDESMADERVCMESQLVLRPVTGLPMLVTRRRIATE